MAGPAVGEADGGPGKPPRPKPRGVDVADPAAASRRAGFGVAGALADSPRGGIAGAAVSEPGRVAARSGSSGAGTSYVEAGAGPSGAAEVGGGAGRKSGGAGRPL